MEVELSPEAYEFSELLLKHYNHSKHSHANGSSHDHSAEKEAKKEIIEEKIDQKAKYSLNYKKFDGLTEKEEVKLKEDFDDNAYFQQMACTHDRRKERDLFEKPTEEKLEAAESFKIDGNEAIKQKEYEKAAYFYQKGLLQLDYTFPENEKDDKRFWKIQEQLHFNMAMTKYFVKDFDASLTHLNQV